MNKILPLVFFFLLIVIRVNAQQSPCLRESEELYQLGQLAEIPDILEECLDKKTDVYDQQEWIKEEKILARKLLTLTYIYLDDIKNASSAMVKLLKEDPEHEPEEGDPAEFIYLYNKYSSEPFVSVTAKIGGAFTNVSTIETYSLSNQLLSEKDYSSGAGIFFALGFEYRFYKGFDVGLELGLTSRRYTVNQNPVTTTLSDPRDGSSYNYQSLNYNAIQNYLDIPLYVKYTFLTERRPRPFIWPFVFAGFGTSLLLNAELDQLNRTGDLREAVQDEFGGNETGDDSESPPLSINNQRENLNFFAMAGVGAKIKVLRIHYLSVEARYNIGLTNVVDPQNRFNNNNPELLWQFGLVEDDHQLSNLAVNVGFYYSIFRTKDLTGGNKIKKSWVPIDSK